MSTVYIFSGPCGCGKTTLAKAYLAVLLWYRMTLSALCNTILRRISAPVPAQAAAHLRPHNL